VFFFAQEEDPPSDIIILEVAGDGDSTYAEDLARAKAWCQWLKDELRDQGAGSFLNFVLGQIDSNDDQTLTEAELQAVCVGDLAAFCPPAGTPGIGSISLEEARTAAPKIFNSQTLLQLLADPSVGVPTGLRQALIGQLQGEGNQNAFDNYHRLVDRWRHSQRINQHRALDLHIAAWLIEL
jgi:hypothetical protein